MQPRTQLSSAIFIPEEMRNSILERNEIANMIDPNPNPEMPSEIDSYHSLYALEPQPIHQKLPLPSSTYKATHNTTGVKYCLRRLHGSYSINVLIPRQIWIECFFLNRRSAIQHFLFNLGFRIQSTKCMSVVDLWKKFQHSNVVQLREVFTTKAFGDQCKSEFSSKYPNKPILICLNIHSFSIGL